MEQKINVAELLKNHSERTELYSPICGECYLDKIDSKYISVMTPTGEAFFFNYDGTYCLLGEMMLFPSKENRDWSSVLKHPTNGDVVVAEDPESAQMFIVKEYVYNEHNHMAKCYIGYEFGTDVIYEEGNWSFDRIATEEERKKLLDAIKTHGYKWNDETKTLEKLVEPKFKVGDEIVKRNFITSSCIVSSVSSEYYGLKLPYDSDKVGVLPVSEQDDWVLVPNKFDINTLKPFESKVLVKLEANSFWIPSFFGFYNKESSSPYICCNGFAYKYCIPYEGNEHLLGTTEDCSDYYKI
jgi:hypothetical protein